MPSGALDDLDDERSMHSCGPPIIEQIPPQSQRVPAEPAPEFPRVLVFVDLGLTGTYPFTSVEGENRLGRERDSLTGPRHSNEFGLDPSGVDATAGIFVICIRATVPPARETAREARA